MQTKVGQRWTNAQDQQLWKLMDDNPGTGAAGILEKAGGSLLGENRTVPAVQNRMHALRKARGQPLQQVRACMQIPNGSQYAPDFSALQSPTS